jgi:hypothetical protein
MSHRDDAAHAQDCHGHHCAECGVCLPGGDHYCFECLLAYREANTGLKREFECLHWRAAREARARLHARV